MRPSPVLDDISPSHFSRTPAHEPPSDVLCNIETIPYPSEKSSGSASTCILRYIFESSSVLKASDAAPSHCGHMRRMSKMPCLPNAKSLERHPLPQGEVKRKLHALDSDDTGGAEEDAAGVGRNELVELSVDVQGCGLRERQANAVLGSLKRSTAGGDSVPLESFAAICPASALHTLSAFAPRSPLPSTPLPPPLPSACVRSRKAPDDPLLIDPITHVDKNVRDTS
ncbi:uncharacterized protein TRAVEDRAFT_74517 [Trametes versicolor FP-101664 SS1]|uniref:uncharacterized protein n=1 Tax=Trametes versicolor (strain FP-101664) TaxID=717944 RepID=UPI000462143F|nr:uncharacterized protein TRAVEDRAFT_74517 [Trametes versicolor FP-101664 SS1]EIW54468.1 hypothetical protein TRAVEDRAFT_74517 [Trametes versicolor FP-101664 SS1]